MYPPCTVITHCYVNSDVKLRFGFSRLLSSLMTCIWGRKARVNLDKPKCKTSAN